MPQPLSSSILTKPTTLSTSTPSCSLLLIPTLLLLTLFSLFHHHQNPPHPPLHILHFQHLFLSSATNSTLSSYLRSLTLLPHLAGTSSSLSTASFLLSHFRSLDLSAHLTNYTALLSYPTHSSLSAHFPNNSLTRFSLPEPGSLLNGVVMPYHAYSPSGSAFAKAVFVNHGRYQDYSVLAAQGVDVTGCIAIVRRGGGMSRNAAAATAAEKGVAAVVMYTEGEEEFKEGVERGTVMEGMGDPLSPGWASVEGGEMLGFGDGEVVGRFPGVPSMPVSAETAEKILRTLEGGRVPYEWRGTLKNGVGGLGPGPTMLNFSYQGKVKTSRNGFLEIIFSYLHLLSQRTLSVQGEKRMATIHNVFAIIKGSEEPDRFVLLGNHRDAWTYGAVDPSSGTAALLDIARRYALLRSSGWIPRRTIILCSWDAEEFGMIGSTEWMEQNLINLGSKAIAYLNVDCAVQGPGLFAGATPQLDDLLVEVTKKVKDPDSVDVTVFEKWTAANGGISIQRLSGVDSDFAPFLHHAGVPSVDLYFGRDFPVYHTAFDSYNWITHVGDPLFHRHVAVTGIWGLLALHLADDSILPFNYLSYTFQLQNYTKILSNLVNGSISLHPIITAIQELEVAAKKSEEEAKKLREQESLGDALLLEKRALNDRLMFAERGFLDADGSEGSQRLKHLVYGPHSGSGSKLVYFPTIIDAISQSTGMPQARDAAIQHEIWRVARAIQRAAYALNGELT